MRRSIQDGVHEAVALEWRECSLADQGLLRAFDTLRQDAFPWLLDSALHEHGLGRFSFAGSDPYLVLRINGGEIEEHCRRPVRLGAHVGHSLVESDPIDWLRRVLPAGRGMTTDLPVDLPFVGGAVGYLGYEFARSARFEWPPELEADVTFADATVLLVDRVLAVDHEKDRAFALGLGFGPDLEEARRNATRTVEGLVNQLDASEACADSSGSQVEASSERLRTVLGAEPPSGLVFECGEVEYTDRIHTIQEEIAAGNVYEANLTTRMVMPFSGDPWDLYRSLRRLSPAPFSCFMQVPDGTIVGSSPERFLKMSERGEVESRPIKGTRRRGFSAEEDHGLERELALSEKDRAENLMIVDLVRNDLGRVCEFGSVQVPELMKIERYASVFQMVSTVTGRLREDCDALDLVGAAFPPGSMTGAPKIAAVALLEQLEPVRRGVYSGALGYFDLRGGMDLSVVIRTLLLQKAHAYLQVGGAVVADSDPVCEYAEALDKARALWAALSASEANDGEGS
ncbi:MAG: aminodeoxychorismate synthase component I [Myxococcota bacterium]